MKRLEKLLAPNIYLLLSDDAGMTQLSPAERRNYAQRALTDGARQCIDSLHFILCKEDDCDYESEELLEGCWERPVHTEWTDIAAVVLDVYDIPLELWPKLVDDYMNILRLATKTPAHSKLLLTLCAKPEVFLAEIRGIISKEHALEL